MPTRKKHSIATRRPQAVASKSEIQAELKKLRAERKQLITEFGDRGQHHPMNSAIGGLNPAAQKLYGLRQKIAHLETSIAPPSATVSPKGSGRGWDKRGGLLYDLRFGSRTGMIGRSVGASHDFYVVENGYIKSEGYKTLGAAVKAFEKG